MPSTPIPVSQPLPVDQLEAVILDYNGVVGRQPTPDMWSSLAVLAGWPAAQTEAFMRAFWGERAAYDAGELSDRAFWKNLIHGEQAAGREAERIATLRTADTQMWTRTDPAVLKVLRRAHAAGVPMTLLSNAPLPLASALDDTEWCATLMSRTVYSARIRVNKPEGRAYATALAAAGWPAPGRTLFVDDRADNVEAASRLGMRTLHYTGNAAELASRLPQATAAPTAFAA
ncbi:HAD-IA family hydrolase [Streptomyces nigra]|uniref:HAD-IA family hydrolase n=1 Tax=Streptomyces nigra TaxID=1827580 RepID=UPI003816FB2A